VARPLTTKLIAAALLLLVIGAFVAFDLDRFLSLESFKAQQALIDSYVAASPVRAGLLFFVA
jgi:hypothetical protein